MTTAQQQQQQQQQQKIDAPAAQSAESTFVAVPERLLKNDKRTPHINSLAQYQKMWRESLDAPDQFFGKMAKELLHWSTPFTTVQSGSFEHGDIAWFHDGYLNACYNAVDRHALQDPNRIAMVFEPDEPLKAEDEAHVKIHITYGELLRDVCRLANALHAAGLRKGDAVGIYMPMVPEAAVAMLACARLGLVHSVVFAGFSSDALRDRLLDASCRMLITADYGRRAGKKIMIKEIANAALAEAACVEKVVVYRRGTGSVPVTSLKHFDDKNPSPLVDITAPVAMVEGRDVWWDDFVAPFRPYCPPVPMNAEDPLFMLYTSGSTGKPKGLLHTTGGYLLGCVMTCKYVFDMDPAHNDVFGCMADVGWITGHSYVVYGPLSLGVTTVIFESIPTYPDASRYWKLVDRHQITQFYTAPTAIRALRKFGDAHVHPHSLESLRVLGSVGEPINPEAWTWYNDIVGRNRCAVVDTYWQTETGSHVVAPLPGAIPAKPGSASLPFFGIDPIMVNAETGQRLEGNDVTGVLCFGRAWPGMARTVYRDHKRYLDTYFRPYPGLYFTGDGATRDKDGYIWIRGRVDDVINVAGHRLSTAEIESAMVAHKTCAEAAVVGAPDDISGQQIVAYVTLKPTDVAPEEIPAQLKAQVRKVIGPIATPRKVVVVGELPKTRSGKIMRRVLRKIAAGEVDGLGDLTTLADPGIIDTLIEKFKAAK
ncbi:acetyl-coenzyme A synthetase 2 [Sorochytrium milnesiophthora]